MGQFRWPFFMRTPIAQSLIDELAAAFPDRAPVPGTPLDEVWHAAGRAYVVKWLREQRLAQLEDERGYSDELEAN